MLKKQRRLISIVLCIVFATMLASLCIFACFHCGSCCHGETCYICAMIHATDAVIRGCCLCVCIAFALERSCKIFADKLFIVPCIFNSSLVGLKVKLSN